MATLLISSLLSRYLFCIYHKLVRPNAHEAFCVLFKVGASLSCYCSRSITVVNALKRKKQLIVIMF